MQESTSNEPRPITLTVNGQTKTLRAVPGNTLLDAIREDLRDSLPQLRCGQGRCGGCVILLDGRRVLACDIPVAEADGRTVATL